VKKYVPRSIQNIFDRIEAYNESITDVLFSEPLSTTFEVVVYTSLSPGTGTPTTTDPEASNSVSNYNFYSARSKSGHHDHLVAPERGRTRDEYERLRNSHFQAVIKKGPEGSQSPLQGDVWLATLNGGNLVTLVSFQRHGSIVTDFQQSNGGPAKKAHSSGNTPTQSLEFYKNSGFTEAEAKELSEKGCKDPKDIKIHSSAAAFITKVRSSSSFAGWSAAALAGLVANAQAESNFNQLAAGDAVKWYKKGFENGKVSSGRWENVKLRNVDEKCSWGYWQLNICPDDGAGRQLALDSNIDTTTSEGKAMWKAKLADDEFQFKFVSGKVSKVIDITTTDPYDAAYKITTGFERPACKHIKGRERGMLAKKIYDKYKTELGG